MKTISEVRESFWNCNDELRQAWYRKTYRQNDYNANVRCAFVDYVDMLSRDGQISEALANRVTL